MLTKGKIFDELFTPTLNIIAVSVWLCLLPELNDQLRSMQINETLRNIKIAKHKNLFVSLNT